MMVAWRWICDHWWQLALGLGALVVAIVGVLIGRDLDAGERREAHKNEIEAGRKADALEVEIGHERAMATIEAEHSTAVAEMDADNAAKVEKLRRDPSKLARASVRWSRQRDRKRAAGS